MVFSRDRVCGCCLQAQRSRQGARQPGPRPLPELLGSLDREPPAPPPGAPPPAPPLSRLLVENLVDFMAGAARWLEERRAEASTPATAAAVGAGPGPSGSAGVAPPGGGSGGSGAPQLVPPGQGCYSYQQIVRRYVETFRLVSRCKDSFVELRLVEALWDGVVLRPNTPEDMPTVRWWWGGGGQGRLWGAGAAVDVRRSDQVTSRGRGSGGCDCGSGGGGAPAGTAVGPA